MSSGKELAPAGLDCPVDASQLDFELDFFGRLLDRLPEYVEVLKLQAPLLAQRGRRMEALELQRKLVQLLPRDAIVHYDLACTLAVLGHFSEAVLVLGLALQLGYCDFDHLEFDPDLDNLRSCASFRELLESYGVRCEL